jgi:predicted short-subunit dehydrogenase-like oxidoreductase (DUF2520 family)
MVKLIVIGAGKVGTAMAYLLSQSGIEIVGVYNKHYDSAQNAIKLIGSGLPLKEDELIINLKKADLLMITTPDDQISNIIKMLSSNNFIKPVYFMHMSGLLPADILKIKDRDIYSFSLHPLQAVASFEEGIKLLPNSFFTIEGDEQGKKLAVRLADILGVNYSFIDKNYKPLYHAAAVIASNYLVTLVYSSYHLLETSGLELENFREGTISLIEGTINNLKSSLPENALTGPISRGDIGTIKKHLNALNALKPDYVELYKIMGRYTAEMINNKEIQKLFSK